MLCRLRAVAKKPRDGGHALSVLGEKRVESLLVDQSSDRCESLLNAIAIGVEISEDSGQFAALAHAAA